MQRLKRDPRDPREALRERHRTELQALVTAALERGHSAFRIGMAVTGDPAFYKKLLAGHGFRIATLLTAKACMHQFEQPPKPTAFARSLRSVPNSSPSKVLD